jgi:hypothetical protein
MRGRCRAYGSSRFCRELLEVPSKCCRMMATKIPRAERDDDIADSIVVRAKQTHSGVAVLVEDKGPTLAILERAFDQPKNPSRGFIDPPRLTRFLGWTPSRVAENWHRLHFPTARRKRHSPPGDRTRRMKVSIATVLATGQGAQPGGS